MKWRDFHIGILLSSPEGKGFLQVVDRPNEKIGISINGKVKWFPLEEVGIGVGQLPLAMTAQIGQFILFFQRLENITRDFVNDCVGLSNMQIKVLKPNYTAGKLIDIVSKIIREHGDDQFKNAWPIIKSKLNNLNSIRTSIIHGKMLHLNENMDFDVDTMTFYNPNGKQENVTIQSLDALAEEIIILHNTLKTWFGSKGSEIKKSMTK